MSQPSSSSSKCMSPPEPERLWRRAINIFTRQKRVDRYCRNGAALKPSGASVCDSCLHHGVDNVSLPPVPTPRTRTMAPIDETAGNSIAATKDKDDQLQGDAAPVNPWVQFYLDSTAAALGGPTATAAPDHQPAYSHGANARASLVSTTIVNAGVNRDTEQEKATQDSHGRATAPAAPIATSAALGAPTAADTAGMLGSSLAFAPSGATFSAVAHSVAGMHSRCAFLVNANPTLNHNKTQLHPLSATAQALLAGSTPAFSPTPLPTPKPTPHHSYYPMYQHPRHHHHASMYPHSHFQHQYQPPGPVPIHPTAQPAGHYHQQPLQSQLPPGYQPLYQHYPPPSAQAMYYSAAPTPSPPLAPSPLAPPTTPPPPSAPSTHFPSHQHSPTWPPSPTDPSLSAPPTQLNPTNYLLSLASISLAVLQPFLFYQATGSPSASAALRRSPPAALVPKAITSLLITLFISCVMIPAFLTATAVAWARSGKQQALRDMREVVLVVHSRWMGDDLKHITWPLAQGLTVLGNVIEHAPSVSLTPGLVRGALQGVGPPAGWKEQVVERVLRVAAMGAPSVAVLVQYLSPLVPRQVLAPVVAAVLNAVGGNASAPVPVPVPVVGGEGSTIHEVKGKERSPRTLRKSKTSGEGAKSPKKRKSAGVACSKTSSASSRASDSGRS